MVTHILSRITAGTGNRHTVYLRSDLVNDSHFPFDSGDAVSVRIDGKRLIVEAV